MERHIKPTSTIQLLEGSSPDTPIMAENPHIVGVWSEVEPDYFLSPVDAKVIWPIVLKLKAASVPFPDGHIYDLEGPYVLRTNFPIDHPAAFVLLAQHPHTRIYHFFDLPGFAADFWNEVRPEVWDLLGLKGVDPEEAFKDPNDQELKAKQDKAQGC